MKTTVEDLRTTKPRGDASLRIANEAKDVLLTAISHDLSTPLAIISGYSDMLRRDGKHLSRKHREAVNRIVSSAHSLEEVLRRAFAFAQDMRVMTSPGWNRVELGSVAAEAIARVSPTEPHAIHLDFEPGYVNGNVTLLDRLLDNMIANSLRHTPAAAEIWIRVRHDADVVSIIVEDSGPGFPAGVSIIEEATEPSTPGVGLFLIERIAELHGGRLVLGERPGGGARYVIELPAA